MAITSGFFMSIDGDRKYKADFFAQYFATFIGNGVFPNPATNLQIIANDDMTVTVKPGKGWINGYVVFNDDDYILSIDPADGVLNRIDRIILRWDLIDREIKALVKQGAFASAPVAPSLQRDADAYELAIADIAVNKGVTSITQTNITDLRLNKELCGIVHGVVNQVDTTAVFNQFENWYKQTKADYDADMKTWTQEKKDAFNLWYTTNTNEFAERFDAWFNANTTNWDAGFTDWFEEVRGRLTEDPATDILNQLMLHEETTIMSEGGVHDIRVADKSFQYFDGEEWITVNEGFKVGNTSGFKAQARSGLKIEIEFGDPSDSTIIDKNGDVVVLAEWAGTQLRAKKDSYPVDENDGILLVDSKVKNQYKDTPFVHDNLTNGDEWFYMAFPYTKNKVFTVDSANRGSAVATNKLNQPAPSTPTISDLEFDRVTVTGGDVVSLDKETWFDSPHTFTGLTEETDYVAYAKRKETDEFMESDISPGNAFKTPAEQRIYGVRVDESNSNPETRVTYIGDSVGFTPMSGNNGNFDWGSWEQVFKDFEIRPVVLKNKAVNYYLDPSDFTKRADGSSANITGADGDVMNEFGKTLWYKWTDLGSAYTVEVSDKEFPGAVKNAFEIEDGYNLVPYYPLLLTQILGIIFFRSTDSQTALGRGYVDGNSNYATTGGTNTKGYFFGETTGKQQMKFLGIEDFWGNKLWWIDGLVTDASRNLLIGKKGFNDSGNGYASHPSGTSANIGGYIDTVQGGNDKGFIIKSTGGSATTHYADYGDLYSSRVALFGGDRASGSSAGAFNLRLNASASGASATIGGRLFCASNGKIYIGAYLGTTQSGKLRSVSGSSEPAGNKTIGTFRAEAKANN